MSVDHHDSPVGGHDHGAHGRRHGHDHHHRGGLIGAIRHLFAPHGHDHAESLDAATADGEGMRALAISLGGLGITAFLQVFVVVLSGSVALLADTVHNFSDALTAIPLGIAFWLGRRPPDRRHTYGYGRAEDLAGIFIVGMIALSAAVAAWQAVERLVDPQDDRDARLGRWRPGSSASPATSSSPATASGSVAGSARLRSSPTGSMPAPTGSPPSPCWSRRSAPWPVGASPIRSSAS